MRLQSSTKLHQDVSTYTRLAVLLVAAAIPLSIAHAEKCQNAYPQGDWPCAFVAKVTNTVQNAPTAKVFARNAAPIIDTKEKHEFRTMIRQIAKQPANFAGHYIAGSWGCGTGCTQWVIVDAITGKVSPIYDVEAPTPTPGDFSYAKYSIDSDVIVFHGTMTDNGYDGLHYFKMENGKLTPIQGPK
jgi:hypothetical protein